MSDIEKKILLGTSLARPCITVGLMEVAKTTNCHYIAHGATGKGNDQVRFELSAYALNPAIKVIAPWRDVEFCERFQGRADLLAYAETNGIPVAATPKSPWSMDANILHISYESGVLEDPRTVGPKELYSMTRSVERALNAPSRVEITFKKGLPIEVNGLTSALEILKFLNKLGGEHGVGRVDIVENRYIGLKSRGIYETPGGTILYVAHLDLELYCLDREVWRLKRYLQDKMSDYAYNGLWFSPEAEFARHCLTESQSRVNGKVVVEVFKGRAWAIARESDDSLYSQSLASMDSHGAFNPTSATGFIDLQAMRLKEFQRKFGETPNFKS